MADVDHAVEVLRPWLESMARAIEGDRERALADFDDVGRGTLSSLASLRHVLGPKDSPTVPPLDSHGSAPTGSDQLVHSARLLSASEVARVAGCSARAVRKAARSGRLPWRLEEPYAFDPSDVETWMQGGGGQGVAAFTAKRAVEPPAPVDPIATDRARVGELERLIDSFEAEKTRLRTEQQLAMVNMQAAQAPDTASLTARRAARRALKDAEIASARLVADLAEAQTERDELNVIVNEADRKLAEIAAREADIARVNEMAEMLPEMDALARRIRSLGQMPRYFTAVADHIEGRSGFRRAHVEMHLRALPDMAEGVERLRKAAA